MIGRTRTPAEREQLREKILKLKAEGLFIPVIASRCDVGEGFVSRTLREAGIKNERRAPTTVVKPGVLIGALTVLTVDGNAVKCQCACGNVVARSAQSLVSALSIGAKSACDDCQRAARRKNAVVKRWKPVVVRGEAAE
jgi:hypothetical protein